MPFSRFNGVYSLLKKTPDALDRYEWKLMGKKEMFVPYSTQGFHTKPADQLLGPQHVNPNHVRWELHRVWVVEARLAQGKRHTLPHRRFYLDEDTWLALLADGWDASGQLWHTGAVFPVLVPELPAVTVAPYVIYDFDRQRHYQIIPRRPEDYFSPATLAGEGIR